jgi:hypothetical protein
MNNRREPQERMYQTPRLSILGDIREVTKTSNSASKSMDSGSGKGMDKTTG